MIIRAVILLATLLATSHAFAGWISADDYEAGTKLGVVDGISFDWESRIQGQTSVVAGNSVIADAFGYSHNSFGGENRSSSWIENLYLKEVFNGSLYGAYSTLVLNFVDQPITDFSFKATWSSGSPIGLLAYDENGVFQKALQLGTTTKRLPDGTYDEEYHAVFDFNVGSIKIGSLSDAVHVYAVNATVPEPSSLVLIFLGLTVLVFKRNRIQH